MSDAGVRRAARRSAPSPALAPSLPRRRWRCVADSARSAKFAVPVLAAGEIVGDKLPMAPPRVEGPGLVGRVVSGAVSGRVSGGARGARVGAAFALAATYPSQALRAQIVKRTPSPTSPAQCPKTSSAPPLRPSPRPSPAPTRSLGPEVREEGKLRQGARGPAGSRPRGWARGGSGGDGGDDLGAGLALWVHRGRSFGSAGEGGGADPRRARHQGAQGAAAGAEHRDARPLWHELGKGLRRPLGRGGRRGRRKGSPSAGGLGDEPGDAPGPRPCHAPWKQPVGAWAQDLGFHLVYGITTAAAYEAFSA